MMREAKMNIVVLVKLVPDLVEELSIDSSGIALDTEWLRLIINEFDDHAIEQAILIKEKLEANVTVVAPDVEGVDDLLFTTIAKGADRGIKLVGEFEDGINSHAMARAFTPLVQSLSPDLVLTGVQAHDDLDGSVGPLLAEYLGMPYAGYISGAEVIDGVVKAKKEYPGGLIAEMDIMLPAVLGIQSADDPPRYVAISKVRQAMKTATLDEEQTQSLDNSGGPSIGRMFQSETGERATMIDGDEEEVAERLIEIFKELGVL
jgi:electron transfer flavoprotein beta subunit